MFDKDDLFSKDIVWVIKPQYITQLSKSQYPNIHLETLYMQDMVYLKLFNYNRDYKPRRKGQAQPGKTASLVYFKPIWIN